MDQVTINGNNHYSIEKDVNGNISIDGESLDVDIEKINDKLFHILYQNESIVAEIIDIDTESKEANFRINNEYVNVKLKDKFDILLEKMGMSNLLVKKVSEVKAPMPGLILKILVEENQEIKAGAPILILEAMKMENIIKSPIDAVIQKINIKEGENVEKNHKLIEFKLEA